MKLRDWIRGGCQAAAQAPPPVEEEPQPEPEPTQSSGPTLVYNTEDWDQPLRERMRPRGGMCDWNYCTRYLVNKNYIRYECEWDFSDGRLRCLSRTKVHGSKPAKKPRYKTDHTRRRI